LINNSQEEKIIVTSSNIKNINNITNKYGIKIKFKVVFKSSMKTEEEKINIYPI
jgi:hypothetical protein